MNSIVLGSSDPFQHTWNSWQVHLYRWDFNLQAIPGFEMLGITNGVFAMLAAATLLLFVGMRAGSEARAAAAEGRMPRGLAHVMEVFVQFIRDDMMKPNMPHHYARPGFISIFCTFFFFILFCNLLGLMPQPFGYTATGNWWVTAGLAWGGTLMIMIGGGMKEKGPIGFWTGLVPHGVPGALWPLLFAIEVVGVFVKPFALMIRLAANMTAGHIILAVLASFLTAGLSFGAKLAVWPAAGFGLFAITAFEIVIAFIQAYIFTILSCVFVGQSLSHEH